MCFSLEISLATGIFSWSVCLYLLRKDLTIKQYHYVIFLLIFSSMQFADAILWYQDMKQNDINYAVTSYLIPAILSLQILYVVFIIHKINNPIVSILCIYVILWLFKKLNGYSRGACNTLSSPIWNHEFKLDELIIFTILIYGGIYPPVYIFIMTLTLLYYFAKNSGGYASFWCATANISGLYYLYRF